MAVVQSKAQSVRLSELNEKYYIESAYVYTDSSVRSSPNTQLVKFQNNEYSKINCFGAFLGIGKFDYWIAFDVKNDLNTPKEVVFEIQIPRLDSFKVYSKKGSELKYEAMCSGIGTPIEQKPLKSYGHAVKIKFEALSENTLFFRLNKYPGTMRAAIVVYKLESFFTKERTLNSWLSVFTFLGFIVMLTSMISGGIAANKSYLFFGILTLLKVLLILQLFNFLQILQSLGFENLNSSTYILVGVYFQYQFFKIYFKESIRKIEHYLVFGYLLFDFTIGMFLHESALYYFLGYFLIAVFLARFGFELIKKIPKIKLSDFPIIIFQLLVVFILGVTLIKFNVKIADDFFGKHEFEILLWAYFLELITYLVYLIIGMINLNKEHLLKTKLLNQSQQEIIQTQEAERKIIAQDLHDDLGATLSALKGSISKEYFTKESQNLLNKAINDLRAISRRLLPADFETYGFIPSLEKYIDEVNQQQKIKVTFIVFGEILKLNNEKELNIYRIITELVNNSTKYSNGQNATVQLVYHQDYLFVSVEDDGIAQNKNENNLGIGLKNVISRLEYLNATPIEMSGQKGYIYVFEIPYIPNQ